jgi:hypothetical protein
VPFFAGLPCEDFIILQHSASQEKAVFRKARLLRAIRRGKGGRAGLLFPRGA